MSVSESGLRRRPFEAPKFVLDVVMARVLLTMALLLSAFPAKADECDSIVANLIAQTPGLQLDKRVLAEGVDIVYLKHPQAKALSVFCPAPPMMSPALSSDWLQGLPPPSYFQLIGKLGSMLIGVSADVISAGASECQKRALANKEGEDGVLEANGIRIECQVFTRAGGGTALIILDKETSARLLIPTTQLGPSQVGAPTPAILTLQDVARA